MHATIAVCNLVVIRARDLDRAQRFYQALGMRFVQHSHGRGPLHLASDQGGPVFEIYPLEQQDLSTSSTRIGFAVSSVDDAYAALLTAGGESVSVPKDSPWGRRAVVVDPDGHRIELTAYMSSEPCAPDRVEPNTPVPVT